MSPYWYRLNEQGDPKPADLDEFLEWSGTSRWEDRVVGRSNASRRKAQVIVSTVFLGVDYVYDGPPILWETMVFGGRRDGLQRRYQTRADAQQGHDEVMALVWDAESKRAYKRFGSRRVARARERRTTMALARLERRAVRSRRRILALGQ